MAANTGDNWADNSWPFSAPAQGFGNTTTSDAIATAMNPGVSPPNYLTNNHYLFHHRMGQNIRCTPLLLPLAQPAADINYPAIVNQPSLVTMNPAGTPGAAWLLASKQPNPPPPNFPPLTVPPAAINSPPWHPL